jgi:alpha-galactosidase
MFRQMQRSGICASLVLTVFAFHAAQSATVRLDELDLSSVTCGWGKAMKNVSITGTPLSIDKTLFTRGVGVHADSECFIALDGKVKSFSAQVGVDDNARSEKSRIEFFVYGNDHLLWQSGVLKFGEKPRSCHVGIAGMKSLELVASSAGESISFDHADWADAKLEYEGSPPRVERYSPSREEPVILTPAAPPQPRINGPKIYGVRPGSPLLFRIPCTGERPIEFSAEGLPEGLSLDPRTGIITGRTKAAGSHRVKLTARNARGTASREWRLVVGDRLALTPPMGWNSWYIHYDRVSDAVMRQAADQMIAAGMADCGYQYVNIDDCWMKKQGDPPYRDAQGAVLPNNKFPDMHALADYIHSKGLKAGLYTSPGPWTCGGYVGAFEHEAADARKFAAWGFDFLKYDWCSYQAEKPGLAGLKKPYELMWGKLRKLDRDIVFNLCQYGKGDVWTWGGEVGNSWRTTGDLGLEPGSSLPAFYQIGMQNAQHWQSARPSAWNDPDYILIGWVGDAHGMGPGVRTTLTPSEQYSYMSMWSLMTAPLIFSGDMARLDSFTLNILCNHEVIDVDQDPVGKQARIIRKGPRELILAKDLEDGSKAVGIFNLDQHGQLLSVRWTELGLTGNQRVRDLWRQKELGTFRSVFEADVPRHGVILIRLLPDSRKIAWRAYLQVGKLLAKMLETPPPCQYNVSERLTCRYPQAG